jgi:hypothetical protein
MSDLAFVASPYPHKADLKMVQEYAEIGVTEFALMGPIPKHTNHWKACLRSSRASTWTRICRGRLDSAKNQSSRARDVPIRGGFHVS